MKNHLLLALLLPSSLFAQGTIINGSRTLAGTSSMNVQYANEGTTGTTANKLAKLTGAPSTAILAGTSDTNGIAGIVVAGAGTSGTVTIAKLGKASCVFDNATVAGDYVQISSSVAGDCHDAGSTYPTSGQVIGRVTTTNGSVGTYEVALALEIVASSGGGGGSGTVNSGTSGLLAAYPSTGTTVDDVATADSIAGPLYCADAGSTDSYACSLSPSPSAYTAGTHYWFKANTANTGAANVSFNSLGAKTIKKAAGGIATDLADNDIRAGQFVDLVYDGTNMEMQSTLGNAAGGGGGSGVGTILVIAHNGAGQTASTTWWAPVAGALAGSVGAFNGSEGNGATVLPVAGTLSHLCVINKDALSSNGTIVVTVMKGTATTGKTATALTVTIPTNAAANTVTCDTSDTVSVTANDIVEYKSVSNNTGTIHFDSWSVQFN